MGELDRRHLGGGDEKVVGQRSNERLRVLVVVAHPFEKRIADAVRHAADQLTVHDLRMKDAPAVVHEHHLQDSHPAGVDVDLHFRHRRTVGVGHRIDDHAFHRFQPWRHPAGQAVARGAGHRARHFAEVDGHLLHALDVHRATFDLEVRFSCLQEMRRNADQLVAHLQRRRMGRRPGKHRLPAVRAAHAGRHGSGISRDDRDVRHVATKLVGDDLREHGLGALSHGGRAGVNQDPARRTDAHGHRFERTAAGSFDEVRKANADVATLLACGFLPLRKPRPARALQRVLLAAQVVPGVQHGRHTTAVLHAGPVRHFCRGHEIATPHLGAIETQLARDRVEQPLHDENALRMACTTHRGDGHLVGERNLHIHSIGRQLVTDRDLLRRVVRQVDAPSRVRAMVVDQRAANCQQAGLAIHGNLDVPVLIALLRRCDEMLEPILDPFDRPLRG